MRYINSRFTYFTYLLTYLLTSANVTASLVRSPENMKCPLLRMFRHVTVECKSQTYLMFMFKNILLMNIFSTILQFFSKIYSEFRAHIFVNMR